MLNVHMILVGYDRNNWWGETGSMIIPFDNTCKIFILINFIKCQNKVFTLTVTSYVSYSVRNDKTKYKSFTKKACNAFILSSTFWANDVISAFSLSLNEKSDWFSANQRLVKYRKMYEWSQGEWPLSITSFTTSRLFEE